MALGELTALDEREDVVGKLEQPQPVRNARLGAAHPLGDLAQGQLELVGQDRVGAGLFDRGQLLARHVLDQSE